MLFFLKSDCELVDVMLSLYELEFFLKTRNEVKLLGPFKIISLGDSSYDIVSRAVSWDE